MRRNVWVFILLAWLTVLAGCHPGQPEQAQVLARVNEFELSVAEFQEQLAEELALRPDFKLTQQSKREFLEQIIRKELLIQEALRCKIDRSEKFIKGIERYWEQNLIRDLMESQGEQFKKRTLVSQEEVARRLAEFKASGQAGSLPPEQMAPRLERDLREEKQREALAGWIAELRQQANVQIDEQRMP